MTAIDWVRHGQTQANLAHRLQGQLDTASTALTPQGRRQVLALKAGLDVSSYDRIIVSPLRRARQTAALLTTAYSGPISTDERLMEANYGNWTNVDQATLLAAYPQAFDALSNEVVPNWLTKVGGESYGQVQRRVGRLLAELVVAFPDERVLLVSHGLTIKATALLMLGAPATSALLEPPNASLTTTIIEPVTGQRYLTGYGITKK